jgi:cyclophilin family peptidyl-prolyl cis-trans isomerase
MRRPILLLAAAASLAAVAPTFAADVPATPPAPPTASAVAGMVPRIEGLALDGVAEPAWDGALAIPAETSQGVQPSVRVTVSGGRLVVLTVVPEEAGLVSGVRWIVAEESVRSAADAITLAYSPHDSRAPRYVARGAAGQGRATYRFAGAMTIEVGSRWTAETSIPVEDLRLASDAVPVRLAVIVTLRKPNMIAAAPAGSAFGPVTSFALLRPPEGGWSGGTKATVDAKALEAEDAADQVRLTQWQAFLAAWGKARAQGTGSREAIVGPLDAAIAARPDLAVLHLAKGEILTALRERAAARAAFAKGVELLPVREARWALARHEVVDWVEPEGNVGSDYDGVLATIAKAREGRRPDDPGIALAEAILLHRRGDFGPARERFEAVVPRWPVGDDTAAMSIANKKYEQAWPIELGYRKRDEARDLPRARIVTSKGAIDVELCEDDAPNSVANFVWLATKRFYDGTAFHRIDPFFVAQGGDPLSKDPKARPGPGGPGYAIPTERTKRLPFRGVLGFARTAPDTEGSQFFVTTGTASHLEGDYSIFGRVIAGQDVAERLVRGDRLDRVEVLRTRAHEYRPITVAGKPAPEPVATGPTPPK